RRRGPGCDSARRGRGRACPPSALGFFFQAEDGIRGPLVTGVQTCALPILLRLTGAVNPPSRSGGAPTAAAQVSPGTVVRGLLTLMAVVLVLRVRAPGLRGMKQGFLSLAALGVLGPVFGYVHGGSLHDLLADLMDLSKILYALGMIVVFTLLYRRTRLPLEDVLAAIALTGAFAGLSIVLTR